MATFFFVLFCFVLLCVTVLTQEQKSSTFKLSFIFLIFHIMESRNLRTIDNYSPWYVFGIYFV